MDTKIENLLAAAEKITTVIRTIMAEQQNDYMLNRYFDYLKSRIEVGDRTPLTYSQFKESMQAEMQDS